MADTVSSGVSSSSQDANITIDQLAPNNYLTIIWKNSDGKICNTIDIDNGCYARVTRELNNAVTQGIANNKIQYAGQNKFCNVETIAKYISNNTLGGNTQKRVANALINMASGDHTKLPEMVSNTALNVFGGVAEKTAQSLGLSSPIGVFSQVAGENVISHLTNLSQKALDKFNKNEKQLNEEKQSDFITTIDKTQYAGLLIGITTSDTESYEVTIPRKKVESGSDYTTHLLPQPWKKEFNVTLTNKIISLNEKGEPIVNRDATIHNIEATKNKLIEIANSHTTFDIYIRLSDMRMYKRSNVVFSSISFTKDEGSGDTYTCSFTLEPIKEFQTKVFVSKKQGGTGTGSKGKGASGKGSKSSRPQAPKTSSGKPITARIYSATSAGSNTKTFKNESELYAYADRNNLMVAKKINGDGSAGYALGTQGHGFVTNKQGQMMLARDSKKGLTGWVENNQLRVNNKLTNGNKYVNNSKTIYTNGKIKTIITKPTPKGLVMSAKK